MIEISYYVLVQTLAGPPTLKSNRYGLLQPEPLSNVFRHRCQCDLIRASLRSELVNLSSCLWLI